MKREILFRGKRVDNGVWVYGWYCQYPLYGWPLKPCVISQKETENGCFSPAEVDPDTIGRYTGLTDKNGARIFEGDIIDEEGSKCRLDNFVIRWSAAICGFTAGEGKRVWPCLNQATISGYTIVGNIHDNPELLEGES